MDIMIVMSHLGSGGAQKVAVNLANRWTKNGYDVGIITIYGDIHDSVILDGQVRRISIEYTNNEKSKLFFINTFKKIKGYLSLRYFILKYKPDYIISFICPTNIKTILSCYGIKKRKLIISERNNIKLQKFPSHIKIARKLLYRYADVVTANSPGSAIDLEEFVPKSKIKYIPNPVEIPALDLNKTTRESDSELQLLYVGRLVRQKRLDIILEALKLLIIEGHRFKLSIAGDGPLMHEIRDYIDANDMNNYVNIPGNVDNIASFYKFSDIFILCSDYEGTSNALLEAMSYGLTCIVSKNADMSSKLLRDRLNGIVLEENTPDELFENLVLLDNNRKLLHKYGDKARDTSRQFESEKVYSMWDSLLS